MLLHIFKSPANTAQKIKFSIQDFFSKCDQIRSFLRIWLHLLKKSLIENFVFLCAVNINLVVLFAKKDSDYRNDAKGPRRSPSNHRFARMARDVLH